MKLLLKLSIAILTLVFLVLGTMAYAAWTFNVLGNAWILAILFSLALILVCVLIISRELSRPAAAASIEESLDPKIKAGSRDEREAPGDAFNPMEAMVESMTEGVIMIDGTGTPVVFNPQARWAFGVGATENMTGSQWIKKLKEFGLHEIFERCREKHISLTREIMNQQGHVMRCEVSPVKDKAGTFVGQVIVTRDITKEKEIDRMKSEFVSTVSHELRTPITTMREFAAIVIDEIPGKLNKEQKAYMDIITGNIDRLARLINDILDISKIESGKIQLKRRSVNLVKLVENTVLTLNPELEKKKITLKIECDKTAQDAFLDYDRMVQVFTNLIGNAIKFTLEKGMITVAIKDAGESIECRVSDTGQGMGQEDMQRLFQKFQQFDRTVGNGTKGTGLGLAITKELIEIHRGRIWAESEINKGSKFIFTLPKLSAKELMREQLLNCLAEAQKTGAPLALIVFSVENIEPLKGEIGVEKMAAIVDKLEQVILENLRRKSDMALRVRGAVLFVSPETKKDAAFMIVGHMSQIMDGYLSREGIEGKVRITPKIVTYPEDGQTADELLNKVRDSFGGEGP